MARMMPRLALCFAAMIPVFAQPGATLILINGKVWTVNPAQPRAEAIACLGSRIVAVGTNAEIRRWAGPSTNTIDLRGRLGVPGFNDAHVPFLSGGPNLSRVQLCTARPP